MTTWTVDELSQAVKDSTSVRQVLTKLNLRPAGGNYKSIQKFIADNKIDTSHFTGKGWNKGKIHGPKRSLEDYLSNKFPIKSHALRLRLIAEEIKEAKCESCELSEWLGKPIPLELEHIDGDHNNNNLINLMILCPNCHAQTPTYRGKNIRINA